MKKFIIPLMIVLSTPTMALATDYGSRIRNKILPNLMVPDNNQHGLRRAVSCVEINLSPDGTIIDKKISKSTGHSEWDNAVLVAIDKTGVLPKNSNGQVPPKISIKFNATEYGDIISCETAEQVAASKRKEAQRQEQLSIAVAEAEKERKRVASLPGVRIGQTTQHVINNTHWGKPTSVRRTTTAHGTSEFWMYGQFGKGGSLMFVNDRLTVIQN
jgi:TonB family protein